MLYQLLKTVAMLAGVLGLIFGLAYVLKRFNLTGPRAENGTDGWRLLGTRALGPKRHLYVMEIGTRVLVIGATDRMMTTLTEITDAAEKEKLLEGLAKRKPVTAGFQDFLRRAES
jgi:flagellar biosynthetic protein FliO